MSSCLKAPTGIRVIPIFHQTPPSEIQGRPIILSGSKSQMSRTFECEYVPTHAVVRIEIKAQACRQSVVVVSSGEL